MGRARGAPSAVAVAGFGAVMGERRGSAAGSWLERGPNPSAAVQKLLDEHGRRLNDGDYGPTLSVLRDYHGDIDTNPRLEQLREMFCDALAARAESELGKDVSQTFAEFGTPAPLSEEEKRYASAAVAQAVSAAVPIEPTDAGFKRDPEPDPTPEEFMVGLAAQEWAKAAGEMLLRRVCGKKGTASEDTVIALLGPRAHQRLAEEAAGVWGGQLELKTLATREEEDLFIPVRPDASGLPSLAATLQRKNWREFIQGQTWGWLSEYSRYTDDGRRHAPSGNTPGVRGTARYQFARLVRKRSSNAARP